jgi:hypothetical protein
MMPGVWIPGEGCLTTKFVATSLSELRDCLGGFWVPQNDCPSGWELSRALTMKAEWGWRPHLVVRMGGVVEGPRSTSGGATAPAELNVVHDELHGGNGGALLPS